MSDPGRSFGSDGATGLGRSTRPVGGPSPAEASHSGGVINWFHPQRRRTRVVRVGDVEIGGDHPIRIQSMTNTDTMDTAATVEQILRLARAGCEIVRVTAPSIRDAENLREIRKALVAEGVRVPLVADIHFTPNAAMIAADVVEKVRINPGNYADKKKFEVRDYSDLEYEEEIARVHDRFRPLVKRCKKNGVAMRIGTNHGSLSDRIMNRFGDTAEGMVESALEFLDVCEDESYQEIVFSMKASNTRVAIEAYRLLAERLEARAPREDSYPFHVGVTEAGDAEDGRIKSAIGIGALLEDGIGDTIRVSLTEDPVREVPVARAIAERAQKIFDQRAGNEDTEAENSVSLLPSGLIPMPGVRDVDSLDWQGLRVGGGAEVRVELDWSEPVLDPRVFAAGLSVELASLREIECESLLVELPSEVSGEAAAESLLSLREEMASLGLSLPVSLRLEPEAASSGLEALAKAALGRVVVSVSRDHSNTLLLQVARTARAAGVAVEWELSARGTDVPSEVERLARCLAELASDASAAAGAPASEATGLQVVSLRADASLHDHRRLIAALDAVSRQAVEGGANSNPARSSSVIVLRQAVTLVGNPGGVAGIAPVVSEASLIDASVRVGGLLCDGMGSVVSIRTAASPAAAIDLAYRVLQGARQRTTRTEYISCPSCGRTLFDLEEITAKIKAKTAHLVGVKIAIMGCIVNGPGEMADADFGYVGSGAGQVTLYVGQEVVARAVPEAEAADRLVDLIQEHGQWVDRGKAAENSTTGSSQSSA